jgi:pyruvate dehydrogenase E1 component alpha subunit
MSTSSQVLPGPAVRLDGVAADALETAQLRALWTRMTLIREHEAVIKDLNSRGAIRGSTHLYIGMEAGAVGLVAALAPEDLLIGYYRSHGHALALGVPTRSIISEVIGRVTGCCGGRGGTKHLMDVSRNYLGAYAIVGQQVPMGVGLALALKQAVTAGERAPSLTACMFGDGAVNQGVALEAFNLAGVLEVPCLFVCENNEYAVSTPARRMVSGGSIAARAAGFGLASEEVDGMDVLAVYDAAARARREVVNGRPALLELRTYRYQGHSVFQTEEDSREPGELERYKARDPIAALAGRLTDAGVPAQELEDERQALVAALNADAEWCLEQPILAEVSEDDVWAEQVEGLASWGVAA